jgi:hypothetical protein
VLQWTDRRSILSLVALFSGLRITCGAPHTRGSNTRAGTLVVAPGLDNLVDPSASRAPVGAELEMGVAASQEHLGHQGRRRRRQLPTAGNVVRSRSLPRAPTDAFEWDDFCGSTTAAAAAGADGSGRRRPNSGEGALVQRPQCHQRGDWHIAPPPTGAAGSIARASYPTSEVPSIEVLIAKASSRFCRTFPISQHQLALQAVQHQ